MPWQRRAMATLLLLLQWLHVQLPVGRKAGGVVLTERQRCGLAPHGALLHLSHGRKQAQADRPSYNRCERHEASAVHCSEKKKLTVCLA